MFYENYERLCRERGDKPYALAVQLGAKNSAVVAQWKKGAIPRQAMLQKIADHFNITVAELMYGEGQPDPEMPPVTSTLMELVRQLPDDEQRELLNYVRMRVRLSSPPDGSGSNP